MVCRLSSAGSVVLAHGLSCSMACGVFPDPGIKPVSSALTGRFLSIVPPGSPQWDIDKEKVSLSPSSDADVFHLRGSKEAS